MCGINGIIRFDGEPVSVDMLQAMNTCVCHRGPDDHGVFVSRHVGLGHLRLAVIDLSSNGHQPMCYTHGGRTAVMVYNGEVYNFAAIRGELEAKGYTFRSKSDSEVMLAAYLEFGVDCVHRFNGMFAFVIYDVERNLLFGARDRFGEKPLKYYLDDQRMVFSSELKAILTTGVPRELDLDAIDDYLTLQYVAQPRTGFEQIHKLPHAHYFVLDIARRSMQITRYFDLDYTNQLDLPEAEWLDRIDAALHKAVERRLIADVPLGAFLSGGLDSSMIVAAMHRLTKDIRTFSVSFAETGFDESPYARQVAAQYQTTHTEFRVTEADLLANIEPLVYQYEEPYADNSQLATFLLARLTREHVTVALSGDAGDENFGGYDRYRMHALVARWRPLLQRLRPFAGMLDSLGRQQAHRLAIVLETLNEPLAARHFNYTSFFDTIDKARFYRPETRERLSGRPSTPFATLLNGTPLDDLDGALYLDFNSYVPDDLNVKVDLASMRSALEVRAPMLDHEFASLVAQIPWRLKTDTHQGKKIFKRLAERYLPRDIVYRRKHGFGVPVGAWMRGQLKELARTTILDGDGLVLKLMDRKQVERLFDEHQRGRDHGTRMWALLMLNMWHRRFFTNL
jgi:asparagine synthase (glutamine-hydrolysing)